MAKSFVAFVSSPARESYAKKENDNSHKTFRQHFVMHIDVRGRKRKTLPFFNYGSKFSSFISTCAHSPNGHPKDDVRLSSTFYHSQNSRAF